MISISTLEETKNSYSLLIKCFSPQPLLTLKFVFTSYLNSEFGYDPIDQQSKIVTRFSNFYEIDRQLITIRIIGHSSILGNLNPDLHFRNWGGLNTQKRL